MLFLYINFILFDCVINKIVFYNNSNSDIIVIPKDHYHHFFFAFITIY